MPEVEEVFRMATQKVRPDPGALERQNRGAATSEQPAQGRCVRVGRVPDARGGADRGERATSDNGGAAGPLRADAAMVARSSARATTPFAIQVRGCPRDDLCSDGNEMAFRQSRTVARQIATVDGDGTGPASHARGSRATYPGGRRTGPDRVRSQERDNQASS